MCANWNFPSFCTSDYFFTGLARYEWPEYYRLLSKCSTCLLTLDLGVTLPIAIQPDFDLEPRQVD